MIVFCLIACLFLTVSGVSAATLDDNSTQAEISTDTDLVSVDTLGVSDEMSSSAENTSVLGSSDEDKLSLTPNSGEFLTADSDSDSDELNSKDSILSIDDDVHELLGENNNVVSVYTQQELMEAINNETISCVIIKADMNLTSSVNVLRSNFTIDGNGHILDAGQRFGRIFVLGKEKTFYANVTLKNIILMNGILPVKSNGAGLYIYSQNTTITNVTFKNNYAGYSSTTTADRGYSRGAGVFISSTANHVVIEDCNFINNTADYRALEIQAPNTLVKNCQFINNTGTFSEAAIGVAAVNATIDGCYFYGNKATRYNTGCIVSDAQNTHIFNSKFINNYAILGAGALNLRYSNTEVINCTFINNTADSDNGGAIYFRKLDNNQENVTIINCTFTNNTAGTNGGAFYCSAKLPSIENCSFEGNNASNGGALYLNAENGYVHDCNFANNTATLAGGAVYSNAQNSVIEKCNFTNNTATNGKDFYASLEGSIEFRGLEFSELYVTNNPSDEGVANGKGTSKDTPAYWEISEDGEDLIKKFLKWQVGQTTISTHTNKQPLHICS